MGNSDYIVAMKLHSGELAVSAFFIILTCMLCRATTSHSFEEKMFDPTETAENLKVHVTKLTKDIGERSITKPWNIEKTAKYIENFYSSLGIQSSRETYTYRKLEVSNIVADITFSTGDAHVFIIGAHYDSVGGTVGADDNASAVAVQLEVARYLAAHRTAESPNVIVRFVSFALEEPPVYGTWAMGSRIYARKAKKNKERIDGMICLEMVGYACHEPGCQSYPFPLMFLDYPEAGNFIGIVGNFRSRKFTASLFESFKKNSELPVERLTVPLSGYFVPTIRLSDHASFWDKGYKAVMITDTAFYRNPHYHRPSDTMEKLDFQFMSQLVKSLVTYFLTRNEENLNEF